MAEEYVWTQITLLGNIGLIIIWTVFFNSVLTRRFSLPVTVLDQINQNFPQLGQLMAGSRLRSGFEPLFLEQKINSPSGAK